MQSLSEAQIRQHANAESFARGMSYYQRGAVGSLVLRGNQLQAEVEGGEYEPYRVTVSLDAGGVRAASCSCPYDWGGLCKHIVATLLAYIHAAPGAVAMRPPLAELLAGLDRGQLEALLGANPKKAELQRWRERLEGWAASAEEYGCEGLDIALQAAAEGWSEPWVDAAIIGEALPGTRPSGVYTEELLKIRLRILERSGHMREALNLAVAAGMHREQALLLLRQGRVAEAVELGRSSFRNAAEALALAQALRAQHGRKYKLMGLLDQLERARW